MRETLLLSVVLALCVALAAQQEAVEEVGVELTTERTTSSIPTTTPNTDSSQQAERGTESPPETTDITFTREPTTPSTTTSSRTSSGVDPGLIGGEPTSPTPSASPALGDSSSDSIGRIESEDGASSDCDFSESTCWWRLDGAPYRHYSWRRGTPQSAFYLGGPATDAGGGQETAAQGYVFVDSSVFRDVHLPDFYLSAWMTSPARPPPGPAGRCLRFKYAAVGASVHSLRVLRVDHVPTVHLNHSIWLREAAEENIAMPMEPRNLSRTVEDVVNTTGRTYILRHQNVTEAIWEARDPTEGAWREGKVTFNTGFEHRLVFEVVPSLIEQAGRGYVAVDDVSLAEGACDDDCGFEKDFCRWTNASEEDDFDWQLGRGSRRRITGPIRDQSSARSFSRIGGYAFADSSHPRRPGDVARLESAVFETPDPLCLSFYTNMFGAGVGRLSVRQVSGGAEPATRVLWSVAGGSGSQLSWELGRVTLASPARFKVQLEAVVGEPGSGDIAVDSIRVEPGACPTVPASAGGDDASCAFRDDTCAWELSGIGRRLWARAPGGHTPPGSPALQPPDHFLSFAVDGYEHQSGARGRVLSPVLRGRPRVCLSFWVHLASHIASMPRVGGLQVLLVNMTTNATTSLWRVDNHLRHGWVRAQISFAAEMPARLALEAVRGSGVSGVLGVDDLVVHDGDCAVLPAAAAVSALDCWFDAGECLWTVETVDGQESWRSATNGNGIRQLFDHTHRVESGYEYFDPFNQRATARLLSPEVPAGTPVCLSLWYTCLGGVQQDASLSVRRQLGADNSTSELLWQVTQGQSGHTGRRYTWRYGQVSVSGADTTSRLVIEAIGMQAGFAIDDVRTVGSSTPCPIRPDWARPAPPP